MTKRILNACSIILIVLLTTGCASKRFAKQADKLASAGLFQDAAQMYFQSVSANSKNIEAKLGLQRTGQLVLQEKLASFKTHYNNSAPKEAVYAYIDSKDYFNKVKNVGVMLIFPPENDVYFDEMKEKYLHGRYNEGLQKLDVEDFKSTEVIFMEILSIDPTYKDSKTHFITAKYEPLYRTGNEQLANNLYRTAYYTFNEIVSGTGNYKDAITLRTDALGKATITIAIAPFQSSYRIFTTYAQTLQTKTVSEIGLIKIPFYKVVGDELINSFPADGSRSAPKDLIGFISTHANAISAKAVLTARVTRIDETADGPETFTKKGYIKRMVEKVDDKTGEKTSVAVYDKVTYKEIKQKNQSTITFEYTLIDSKTGSILVTDAASLIKQSSIHYATYQGETKNLIPGYWEKENSETAGDVIHDNKTAVNALHNLLGASRQIASKESLTAELINEGAKKIAKSIELYNPEK